MQRKQRTVVLVHGRHLQAHDWEKLVWGEGQMIGTAPLGLHLAATRGAEALIFGTGASQKDGMQECEFTLNFLQAHLALVVQFPEFADFRGGDAYETADVFKGVLSRVMLDRVSQNTDQEIASAISVAKQKGATELLCVTSPAHAARCNNVIARLREKDFDFGGVLPMVISARSSTATYSATDTVVFEHPHRGDDPSPNLSDVLPGIFKISPTARYDFKGALAKLIATYQRS